MTNRLIITVLSLIIVSVLIFNSTYGSQYGGAEGGPISPAPPPVAPITPFGPVTSAPAVAPISPAPPPVAPIFPPSVPIEPSPAPAPIFPPPVVPIEPSPEPAPFVYKPPPPVKFKIGNRNFALVPDGFSPIIYYEDGTIRYIDPGNYVFNDVKNGVRTFYSIFSLNNPRSVSLARLNDNLTYFMMFPQDLVLAKNLKKFKSPVLNKIIDDLYASTTYGQAGSLNYGGRPPVKIVKTGSSTAVLIDPMRQDLYHLDLIKKGETFDYSKRKRVNKWEVNETWDFKKREAMYSNSSSPVDWTRPSEAQRNRFLALNLSTIKNKTKYKCNTDEGAQEFLTDLAFFPELSGCPYESLS